MKYKCSNNHVFIHPAIQTKSKFAESLAAPTETVEAHVCPFCFVITYSEFEEPVTSVKQVNYDEVDALLKDGYQVQAYYANKVTLTKCEAPKT